jgi:hypothetical protein
MPVRDHAPERECEPPAKQRRQPVDLIRLAARPALPAADRGHLADQPAAVAHHLKVGRLERPRLPPGDRVIQQRRQVRRRAPERGVAEVQVPEQHLGRSLRLGPGPVPVEVRNDCGSLRAQILPAKRQAPDRLRRLVEDEVGVNRCGEDLEARGGGQQRRERGRAPAGVVGVRQPFQDQPAGIDRAEGVIAGEHVRHTARGPPRRGRHPEPLPPRDVDLHQHVRTVRVPGASEPGGKRRARRAQRPQPGQPPRRGRMLA